MIFKFETKCLSSLEKVFPDEELHAYKYNQGSALLGETYAFQIAYRSATLIKHISVSVLSPLQERITLRTVGLVPSELPCNHRPDNNVLRHAPGLYPDPLYPIDVLEGVTGMPYQWRSIWVSVELDHQAAIGLHSIIIHFTANSGELLAEESFALDVIQADLPMQSLIHTEWFHSDCLAAYYGVEVFSEAHWRIVEQFVETAVQHGMNMVLTPLFTPPIDTLVGGERPTVQLVDVKKEGETYTFGFTRLQRWVDMCNRAGMRYLEFSHLFTQWGAKHAPKIMAEENGIYKRIFGWDTDATGEDYKGFLNQFLPTLVEYIRQQKLEQRSYFHISDEPLPEHMPWYRSASELMKLHLGELMIFDALSNYEYYELGLVKRPVVANNHIEPFLAKEVPDLWTYYSCTSRTDVSNRFFIMPSARNRIIGIQLYKFQIAGFLHWGYNFWNSQYSLKPIDPFRNTDADCSFPSGDAFLVYPGRNGPIESLRLEVFHEGLQDMRALQLLESLIGRDKVLQMIEEGLSEALTFSKYPTDAAWLLKLRESVNLAIREKINEVISCTRAEKLEML